MVVKPEVIYVSYLFILAPITPMDSFSEIPGINNTTQQYIDNFIELINKIMREDSTGMKHYNT